MLTSLPLTPTHTLFVTSKSSSSDCHSTCFIRSDCLSEYCGAYFCGSELICAASGAAAAALSAGFSAEGIPDIKLLVQVSTLPRQLEPSRHQWLLLFGLVERWIVAAVLIDWVDIDQSVIWQRLIQNLDFCDRFFLIFWSLFLSWHGSSNERTNIHKKGRQNTIRALLLSQDVKPKIVAFPRTTCKRLTPDESRVWCATTQIVVLAIDVEVN